MTQAVTGKSLGPPYKRPAMRGRYLIRNPKAAGGLQVIDALLSPLRWGARAAPAQIKRILVCNWAHLGDVVLTLPFLRELNARYPDATIDVLAGSWTQALIADSKLADNIITVDHWVLNRTNLSKPAKWMRYKKMSLAAISQIRRNKYDVAIDLYQYFPNAAFELRAAGIPFRIGYDSGGFSPFLSRSVSWRIDGRHVSQHHFDLLDLLPNQKGNATAQAFYPPPSAAALAEVDALGLPESFALVHPGTGAPFREWPEARWIELLAWLRAQGIPVVIAGSGVRERERAARIAQTAPDVVNLCDKLSWSAFVAVVSRASFVVCLDSMSGHVAAGLNAPAVCILTGSVDHFEWGPLNPRAIHVSHAVECAPCYRMGCDEMLCVRQVTTEDVIAAIQRLGALPSGGQIASSGPI